MSQENPYAVSELCAGLDASGIARQFDDPDQFDVELPFLLCGRHVKLPAICILSGDTTDLVPASALVTPRWLVFGRPCEIDYFLSRPQRRKLRLRRAAGAGLSLAGIAFGISGIPDLPSEAKAWWVIFVIITILIMFLAGIYFIYAYGQVNLSVDRHDRGKRFWISGFRTSFLELLQRQVDVSKTQRHF